MAGLLDAAIEKLPPLRKARTKRIFARKPSIKQECLDEVCLAVCANAECAAVLGTAKIAELLSGSSCGTATFELDLDQLERFLQIIIEYLPQILEIIMKLFA
jgi:hypothetical protein